VCVAGWAERASIVSTLQDAHGAEHDAGPARSSDDIGRVSFKAEPHSLTIS
jgi:hypothetical protein